MAELDPPGPQASSGVVSLSPRPPPPPPPGLGWASFSHTKFLCVGGRQEGGRGAGPGQLVCARPYLLGVGRRAGAWRSSFTKPALSPLAAGPQELALLPSCPTKGLPSTTTEAPHAGTPSLPVPARSKPKPGMPQVRPSRSHQGSNFQKGEPGREQGPVTSGLWLMGRGLCLGRH